MANRFSISESEAFSYHPANHEGTLNRRLIGEHGIESRVMEVLRGTLQPSGGAVPHAHPGIEQAVYVLSGTARVTVAQEVFNVGPGDCCYFPANAMHSFVATGDAPAEIIVIYVPPYAEREDGVIRQDGARSGGAGGKGRAGD